jgi:hypothetical protein
MKIDDVVAAIGLGRVRVTNRADEELHAHGLTIDEVCAAMVHSEIIEQDPVEKRPFPSCRASGRLSDGAPVHAVWAWNPKNSWTALINAYRPDAAAAEAGGERMNA